MLLWSIASERRMSQSFPHTKFVWSAVKCTIEFNWLKKKAAKYIWPITERVFGKNTGDLSFDFLFIPNFHISIFSEMSPPRPGIYFLFSFSAQCRRSLCWRHCLNFVFCLQTASKKKSAAKSQRTCETASSPKAKSFGWSAKYFNALFSWLAWHTCVSSLPSSIALK